MYHQSNHAVQREFAPISRQKVYRFAPVMEGDDGLVARLQGIISRQAAQIVRLEELAVHDRLTGALNWLGMERELTRAVYDHQRYGHGGAVLMLDLNGFKPINDTYGHAAGDAMLVHVAGLLRKNVRASDAVARMGGDEFVIILKEATLAGVAAKAAQLGEIIANTPCRWQGKNLWVTASLGGAALDEAGGAKSVLARADARMYDQKINR